MAEKQAEIEESQRLLDQEREFNVRYEREKQEEMRAQMVEEEDPWEEPSHDEEPSQYDGDEAAECVEEPEDPMPPESTVDEELLAVEARLEELRRRKAAMQSQLSPAHSPAQRIRASQRNSPTGQRSPGGLHVGVGSHDLIPLAEPSSETVQSPAQRFESERSRPSPSPPAPSSARRGSPSAALVVDSPVRLDASRSSWERDSDPEDLEEETFAVEEEVELRARHGGDQLRASGAGWDEELAFGEEDDEEFGEEDIARLRAELEEDTRPPIPIRTCMGVLVKDLTFIT